MPILNDCDLLSAPFLISRERERITTALEDCNKD